MKAVKATLTNDLTSTDDAQYNMSKKNYSTKQQSGIITKESHTSPPKYNEYLESKHDYEELSCKNNIEQNKAQKPSNRCPPKKMNKMMTAVMMIYVIQIGCQNQFLIIVAVMMTLWLECHQRITNS
eukprot:XP_016657486.1 PREDICTED: uncharacterized protein LOC100574205 isoform X4 [Acyrthosiphon pisum]